MDRYTVQTTSQVILQLHYLTVSILTRNNSIPINATVNLSKLPWENWQNSTYCSFVGFSISKWKHTKAIFHTALNSRKTDDRQNFFLLSKSKWVADCFTALGHSHADLGWLDQCPQEGLGRFLTPSKPPFLLQKKINKHLFFTVQIHIT